MSAVAVPPVNNLKYEAKDARGTLASSEHIEWSNGQVRLSVEQIVKLCTKAEAAFVSRVDSWNTAVAVYRARQILRGMTGHREDKRNAVARAAILAAAARPLSGSPSSAKKKRQDAEDSLSYLDYDGRIWPILLRQGQLANEFRTRFDNPRVISSDFFFDVLG